MVGESKVAHMTGLRSRVQVTQMSSTQGSQSESPLGSMRDMAGNQGSCRGEGSMASIYWYHWALMAMLGQGPAIGARLRQAVASTTDYRHRNNSTSTTSLCNLHLSYLVYQALSHVWSKSFCGSEEPP